MDTHNDRCSHLTSKNLLKFVIFLCRQLFGSVHLKWRPLKQPNQNGFFSTLTQHKKHLEKKKKERKKKPNKNKLFACYHVLLL